MHTRWQIPGPFERELLALLDGSRDTPSVLAALVEAVRSDRLPAAAAVGELADDERLHATLKARLDAGLEMLARAGLLLA